MTYRSACRRVLLSALKCSPSSGGQHRHAALHVCLALAGAALLTLLLAACFAPDPYAQDLANALAAPSSTHLLGTDRYGRDLLSRIVFGAWTTLSAAALVISLALSIGSSCGVVSRMCGGSVYRIFNGLGDGLLAIPPLVLAIAMAGLSGGGLLAGALALTLALLPKYMRLSASLAGHVLIQPYIDVARTIGTPRRTILWRHVLPNIMTPLFITAALDCGTVILELSALSFLGFGAPPPTPEWGQMLNEGRDFLPIAPHLTLAPGLAILLVVAFANRFADVLRAHFDIYHKKSR